MTNFVDKAIALFRGDLQPLERAIEFAETRVDVRDPQSGAMACCTKR